MQTGRITFKNLKRVVTEIGENIPDEELRVRWRVMSVLSHPVMACLNRLCWRRWRGGDALLCVSLVQEMIAEADRNGDNAVDADEFYRVMRKRAGNALDDIDSDDD